MTSFRALVLNQTNGDLRADMRQLSDEDLPDGDVTVAVAYSSLNYKDGLILNGLGGLVKTYPHIPGIDYAGIVLHSADTRFSAGDRVVGTGFRVGEIRSGGYAGRVRVSGDWLVHLPDNLALHHAMGLGSAGLTAAIALHALEEHGLQPDRGKVLITGASGGVGSVAVVLLSHMGYDVVASTGRPENVDYLRSLGASEVLPRTALDEPSDKPLESARWSACIDSVGGVTLARVLAQIEPGGSVAAIGLAGGAALPTTVIPFILRGINLLGIDSVFYPNERRCASWEHLGRAIPTSAIDAITRHVDLADVVPLGKEILAGHVRGRIVVDIEP